ncbi:hypothetical protein [Brucella tritici]|uniref:hypothetical protein n=1 Tax=Brucella tritici TaxID=94626 RepID=UPI001F35E253|nr:hypothetical protein [Brucella tritici]
MAFLSDYTSGTITLANGSATVTGTGTLFEVTRFREGDTLQIQNLTAVIASVDSDTQLTLVEPWTGESIVNGAYRARQLGDGSRVSTQAATIIELLGNGVLINLAGLGVEEGKAPVGGPTGEYELVDTSTFGIQDPNGNLDKLAALTLAANKLIVTDAGSEITQASPTEIGVVSFNQQSLTSAQQGQAIANIGVGRSTGFRDYLINGNFLINQRGNNFNIAPGATAYTSDRWRIYNATNATVNVQCPSVADIPAVGIGSAPRLRIQTTTAPTSGVVYLSQFIEGANTVAAGKVTLTLWTAVTDAIQMTGYLSQQFGVGGSPDATSNAVIFQASVGPYGKTSMVFDVPPTSAKIIGANDRVEMVVSMPIRTTGAI